MNVVRTAIVGMGIGKQNACGIAAARGAVVALCDLLENRMQEFAKERLMVKFYTSYQEMCRDRRSTRVRRHANSGTCRWRSRRSATANT